MKYVEDRIKMTTNQFWKDVLQPLININKKTLATVEYVLTSPIYYNKNIQIGGTHIYYKSWFENGIKYVNDLINDHGEFYDQTEFIQKNRHSNKFFAVQWFNKINKNVSKKYKYTNHS